MHNQFGVAAEELEESVTDLDKMNRRPKVVLHGQVNQSALLDLMQDWFLVDLPEDKGKNNENI